jgi:hypothetical protein
VLYWCVDPRSLVRRAALIFSTGHFGGSSHYLPPGSRTALPGGKVWRRGASLAGRGRRPPASRGGPEHQQRQVWQAVGQV